MLVPLDLPPGGTPTYAAVRNLVRSRLLPMRFSVFLILFLVLIGGVAHSQAWAHEGDAAQPAFAQGPSGLVYATSPEVAGSGTVGTMPDEREHAGLGIPARHHDDRPGGLDCLSVASCGGASGIVSDGDGIPVPRQVVPAPLVTAGDSPRSVDLPLEDHPPRTA